MRAAPSTGWCIRWTADTPTSLSFEVGRCFYVEVLEALGAGDLAVRFCGLDDLRDGALRTIACERAGTIATGRAVCDFRFTPRSDGPGDVTP